MTKPSKEALDLVDRIRDYDTWESLSVAFSVTDEDAAILIDAYVEQRIEAWMNTIKIDSDPQPYLTPTCAGGADISTEECPLCGATPDQRCPHNESHS